MSTHRMRFLFLSAVLVLLALWVRLTSLYSLPVFIDEANHLLWAQRFSTSNTVYPLFMDGKFLMGVTVALFQPLGPSPLWLARAIVGLISVLNVAACILGGSLLGSRRAGLLAGLLYALMPYAVFHERQLLADPLMSTFGAMALVFTLQLAKRGGWVMVVASAAALAAAFMSKFFGGLYVLFPLLSVVMLPSPRSAQKTTAGALPRRGPIGQLRWRSVHLCLRHRCRQDARLLQQLAAIALAALMVILFIALMSSRLGYNDQKLASQQIGFVGCPPLICEGDLAAQLENLRQAGRTLHELVQPYFGWPLVALAFLAPLLGSTRDRRALALISLATLAMLLAFVATARSIPPRYVAFLAAPLAILAAHALVALGSRFAWAAPALLLILLWPFANTAGIVLDPTRANLPDLDRQQYVTQASSGGGVAEAAMEVTRRDTDLARPPVVLLGNAYGNSVAAYLDRTRIDMRGAGEAYPRDLGGWLFNGQAIYLIDEGNGDVPGLFVEEIGAWPRMDGASTLRLFRVTGVDEARRTAIFNEFFLRPETLAPNYRALIDSLPADEPISLLVYPPTQTNTLTPLSADSKPNVAVIPIGDSWPLDAPAAESELDRIAETGADLRVAFLEETKGDSGRRIETWLDTHLFKVDEQWFGPVRVVAYGGRGSDGLTIPVGVTFGDGLALESVEVFDPAPAPGGLIRLRLNWRVATPTAQQLKIFTHLFTGEAILAQHDGQPVGELRPTNTWQAGEIIRDQFAIRLPREAKPGVYQLRIGMYDVSTQARLPALLPDGSAGEFFVGGEIVVK